MTRTFAFLLRGGPFDPHSFPLFGGSIFLMVFVGILLTVFWLSMITICILDRTMSRQQKYPWIIFMLMVPILSTVLYLSYAYPWQTHTPSPKE